MRRGCTRLVAVGLLVAAAAGCAGSSRTDDDYRHKAAHTLASAVSCARVVVVGVNAAADGDLTAPYVSVLVNEADKDLRSADDDFLSRQPPSEAADEVRDQVEDLLSAAQQSSEQIRTAARRGQISEVRDQARRLSELADRMEQKQEQLG